MYFRFLFCASLSLSVNEYCIVHLKFLVVFCTPHRALHKIACYVCYACICVCVYACAPAPMLRTEDNLQESLLFYHMGPWDRAQVVWILLTEPSSQPPLGSYMYNLINFLVSTSIFFKKYFFLFYVHRCFACMYICVALNLWSCCLHLLKVEIRGMDLELFLIGHSFFHEFLIALGQRSDIVDLVTCV